MLLFDTDNAAGSTSGDVDDAFAVAALLCSGLPVAAVASVGGNTSEAQADQGATGAGDPVRSPYQGTDVQWGWRSLWRAKLSVSSSTKAANGLALSSISENTRNSWKDWRRSKRSAPSTQPRPAATKPSPSNRRLRRSRKAADDLRPRRVARDEGRTAGFTIAATTIGGTVVPGDPAIV